RCVTVCSRSGRSSGRSGSRTPPARSSPLASAAPTTWARPTRSRPCSPRPAEALAGRRPRLPGGVETRLCPADHIERILLPERVLEVHVGERPVVGEDLEVDPLGGAAAGLDRPEDSRQVDRPLAGERAVEVIAGRLALVADVHGPGEPAGVSLGVGE